MALHAVTVTSGPRLRARVRADETLSALTLSFDLMGTLGGSLDLCAALAVFGNPCPFAPGPLNINTTFTLPYARPPTRARVPHVVPACHAMFVVFQWGRSPCALCLNRVRAGKIVDAV